MHAWKHTHNYRQTNTYTYTAHRNTHTHTHTPNGSQGTSKESVNVLLKCIWLFSKCPQLDWGMVGWVARGVTVDTQAAYTTIVSPQTACGGGSS